MITYRCTVCQRYGGSYPSEEDAVRILGKLGWWFEEDLTEKLICTDCLNPSEHRESVDGDS
jgi:hypothetical protein